MENRETVPEKELMTPFIRVRKFQETLHAKAKESPELRFHFLYDKVWRANVWPSTPAAPLLDSQR